MRRVLSLILVLSLLAFFAFSLSCAAVGTADEPAPELDKNFDVDLATTLIIIISSVLLVLILIATIVLAKRNIHN